MSSENLEKDGPGAGMNRIERQPRLRRSVRLIRRPNALAALGSIQEDEKEGGMQPLPPPPKPPVVRTESGPDDARRPDLSWQSPHLLDFVMGESEEVRENILLLDQNRDDHNITIECGGRVWKIHRRLALKSPYFRPKLRLNSTQLNPTLTINDINLTSCRMDLYLLWLYTGRFTVLTRWVDKLWPEDDLEGMLEILVMSAILPGESELSLHVSTEVEARFATKLWILSDADVLNQGSKIRKSADHCLEVLFEQEFKTSRFNLLRTVVMVEIFKKAEKLLPKHKWLEDWIRSSPPFKSVFQTTRKSLLENGFIIRHISQAYSLDTDEADARCEEFRDIWLGEEDTLMATTPSLSSATSDRGSLKSKSTTTSRNPSRRVSFADQSRDES